MIIYSNISAHKNENFTPLLKISPLNSSFRPYEIGINPKNCLYKKSVVLLSGI